MRRCDWPANRAADGRAPALQVGYGPDPGRDKALVNVIVEFSGPTESMTLTVIVPNLATKPPSKNKALQEQRTSRCNSLPFLLGSSLTARAIALWSPFPLTAPPGGA
jgi:hypothetical protein